MAFRADRIRLRISNRIVVKTAYSHHLLPLFVSIVEANVSPTRFCALENYLGGKISHILKEILIRVGLVIEQGDKKRPESGIKTDIDYQGRVGEQG